MVGGEGVICSSGTYSEKKDDVRNPSGIPINARFNEYVRLCCCLFFVGRTKFRTMEGGGGLWRPPSYAHPLAVFFLRECQELFLGGGGGGGTFLSRCLSN